MTNAAVDWRERARTGPVHFLGLGGAGVSGAARVLAARGVRVSGHDRAPSDLLRALLADLPEIAATVGASNAADLPGEACLVVRSAAVPDDDPQVVAALAGGVPVVKYAELLGELPGAGRGLAVAGTHGKTTTSWLLWHALMGLAREAGGELPGCLIGGLLTATADGPVARALTARGEPTTLNARAADADGWFVVEACEYDRSFLHLAPHGAIVTNVEADHLDYYGTLAAIEEAFGAFVAGVEAPGAAAEHGPGNAPSTRRDAGLVVLGPDVPASVEAAAAGAVWRLGRELVVEDLGVGRGGRRFRLAGPGWRTPEVELAVPGGYNVTNAALALGLAIGLAVEAGADPQAAAAAAARGVAAFGGSARRFETWGHLGAGEGRAPVRVVHDYAHHPTELEVLLRGAHETFPDHELHVLFQPHQASRTARLFEDFVAVFAAAPIARLVVAPVYGARRHIDGANTAGALALAARVADAGKVAVSPETLDASVAALRGGLDPERPALALVVGAGDVEETRAAMLEPLEFGSASQAAGQEVSA